MSNGKLNLLIERLIREELKKSLLSEATLNLDEDVDYIYDKAFKNFFEKLLNRKFPELSAVMKKQNILLATIQSSELPSQLSQQATAVKPITIYCGIFFDTISHYDVEDSRIVVKIAGQTLQAVYNGYTEKDFEEDIQKAFLADTSSPSSLKGTIYHELSHWIRDSLNNRHIEKLVGKISKKMASPLGKGVDPSVRTSQIQNIKDQGHPDTYMTNYELDAAIHQIKQKKRDTDPDTWNSMSFIDMIREINGINTTYRRLTKKYMNHVSSQKFQLKPSWKKDWAEQFVKMLLKRMSREGLVGNKMKYLR